jgi:hypothetical protein
MKISRGHVVITDVPGIEKITVSVDRERIVISHGSGTEREWNVTELTQFRDALTEALNVTNSLPPELRTFDSNSPEPPADVKAVRDSDGDVWAPRGTGWECNRDGDSLPWSAVRHYAPLTEVRDDA